MVSGKDRRLSRLGAGDAGASVKGEKLRKRKKKGSAPLPHGCQLDPPLILQYGTGEL